MKPRSMFAEFLGTALLVFFGAGTATLSFGFKITGTSLSAGVVATARSPSVSCCSYWFTGLARSPVVT